MVKALFFDIDGTLVSFRTHQIPQSTLDALAEARRRGVKVFIATGRPRPFVEQLTGLEYDGMITANGGSVLMREGDRMVEIVRREIPREDLERMVECQKRTAMPVAYASSRQVSVTLVNDTVMEVFQLLGLECPGTCSPDEAITDDGIIQVIAFFTKEQEEDMMTNVLSGCNSLRWHPWFTDCTAKGVNKAVGVDDVCRHLGIDVADTMGFGDGGNDIAMLRHVGTGVAMGNASDEVKRNADFVTTEVDEDGIANALRHFHVVD